VQSVTVIVSSLGGSAAAAMADAGNGTRTVSTTATVASPVVAGAYQPVHLPVNATAVDGTSSTPVAIPLTVAQNGDANVGNRVMLYTTRYVLGIAGYETLH